MKPRSLAILQAIADYTAEHERPPTQREMAEMVPAVTSRDMARNDLSALQRGGYVTCVPMTPRSCRLTAAGLALLNGECHTNVTKMG